ncbi:hypothetical protein ATS75_00575 [Pseudoalteromonas sp. H105]|nr:hypothetical protein ATS75_00575 [Pseudoalteromonas sp. H105]
MSARADWHNEYGTQFSPRISMLYKPENWTVRGSYGKGFFASIDISYTFDSVETSVTLFSSDVENVTELEGINQQLTPSYKSVRIINSPGQSEIRGAEFLLRYRWNDIKLTGSYLYTDASKQSNSGIGRVPLTLTPEHSAGAVIMWEEHGSHLVGFEAYYTGTQHLENNPYRDRSDAYWHLGLLGQITVGRISYFLMQRTYSTYDKQKRIH